MRFASLGSGSNGNATIIQSTETTVMLDCGFSCKEAEKRFDKLKLCPTQVDAIVVTHEHNDHIGGVGVFSRKYKVPVWMNYGTARDVAKRKKLGKLAALNIFSSHQSFEIKDMTLTPFPVPHDAKEAVQFVFSHQQKRLGVMTDLGHITAHAINQLKNLDALVLEANHDPLLLQEGSYSPGLKQRVGGPFGHLNNFQAANLLQHLDLSRLQHLVIAHLSGENNTPEHASNAFKQALGELPEWFYIAYQESGFCWKDIESVA